MSEKIYTVLYTHQKLKKAKTWQDGTLKIFATGTKAALYDENGAKLDIVHVHACDVVVGEQLESDRYLIQIEEEGNQSATQQSCSGNNRSGLATLSSELNSSFEVILKPCSDAYSSVQPLMIPSGCTGSQTSALNGRLHKKDACLSGYKRKRGFVPPRLVRPHLSDDQSASPEALFLKQPTLSVDPSSYQTFIDTSNANSSNSGKVPSSRTHYASLGASVSSKFGFRSTSSDTGQIPAQNLRKDSSPVTAQQGVTVSWKKRTTCVPESHSPESIITHDSTSPVLGEIRISSVTSSSPWRMFGATLLRSPPGTKQNEIFLPPCDGDSGVNMASRQTSQVTVSQALPHSHSTDYVVASNSCSTFSGSNIEKQTGIYHTTIKDKYSSCPEKNLKEGTRTSVDVPLTKRSAAEIMALLQREVSSSSQTKSPKLSSIPTMSEGCQWASDASLLSASESEFLSEKAQDIVLTAATTSNSHHIFTQNGCEQSLPDSDYMERSSLSPPPHSSPSITEVTKIADTPTLVSETVEMISNDFTCNISVSTQDMQHFNKSSQTSQEKVFLEVSDILSQSKSDFQPLPDLSVSVTSMSEYDFEDVEEYSGGTGFSSEQDQKDDSWTSDRQYINNISQTFQQTMRKDECTGHLQIDSQNSHFSKRENIAHLGVEKNDKRISSETKELVQCCATVIDDTACSSPESMYENQGPSQDVCFEISLSPLSQKSSCDAHNTSNALTGKNDYQKNEIFSLFAESDVSGSFFGEFLDSNAGTKSVVADELNSKLDEKHEEQNIVNAEQVPTFSVQILTSKCNDNLPVSYALTDDEVASQTQRVISGSHKGQQHGQHTLLQNPVQIDSVDPVLLSLMKNHELMEDRVRQLQEMPPPCRDSALLYNNMDNSIPGQSITAALLNAKVYHNSLSKEDIKEPKCSLPENNIQDSENSLPKENIQDSENSLLKENIQSFENSLLKENILVSENSLSKENIQDTKHSLPEERISTYVKESHICSPEKNNIVAAPDAKESLSLFNEEFQTVLMTNFNVYKVSHPVDSIIVSATNFKEPQVSLPEENSMVSEGSQISPYGSKKIDVSALPYFKEPLCCETKSDSLKVTDLLQPQSGMQMCCTDKAQERKKTCSAEAGFIGECEIMSPSIPGTKIKDDCTKHMNGGPLDGFQNILITKESKLNVHEWKINTDSALTKYEYSQTEKAKLPKFTCSPVIKMVTKNTELSGEVLDVLSSVDENESPDLMEWKILQNVDISPDVAFHEGSQPQSVPLELNVGEPAAAIYVKNDSPPSHCFSHRLNLNNPFPVTCINQSSSCSEIQENQCRELLSNSDITKTAGSQDSISMSTMHSGPDESEHDALGLVIASSVVLPEGNISSINNSCTGSVSHHSLSTVREKRTCPVSVIERNNSKRFASVRTSNEDTYIMKRPKLLCGYSDGHHVPEESLLKDETEENVQNGKEYDITPSFICHATDSFPHVNLNDANQKDIQNLLPSNNLQIPVVSSFDTITQESFQAKQNREKINSSNHVCKFFQTISDMKNAEACYSSKENFLKGIADNHFYPVSKGSTKEINRSCENEIGGDLAGDVHYSTEPESNQFQKMAFSLPHPSHLVSGNGKGILGVNCHKKSTDTQSIIDIASIKLAKYRMHGMMSGEVAKHPAPCRQQISLSSPKAVHSVFEGKDCSPFHPHSLCQIQPVDTGKSGMELPQDYEKDFFAGSQSMVSTGHCHWTKQNKSALDMKQGRSRACAPAALQNKDESVAISDHAFKSVANNFANKFAHHELSILDTFSEVSTLTSRQPQSPWTPEAKLQSPSDSLIENRESSFFVDWNERKPHCLESPLVFCDKRNQLLQNTSHTPNGTHEEPLYREPVLSTSDVIGDCSISGVRMAGVIEQIGPMHRLTKDLEWLPKPTVFNTIATQNVCKSTMKTDGKCQERKKFRGCIAQIYTKDDTGTKSTPVSSRKCDGNITISDIHSPDSAIFPTLDISEHTTVGCMKLGNNKHPNICSSPELCSQFFVTQDKVPLQASTNICQLQPDVAPTTKDISIHKETDQSIGLYTSKSTISSGTVTDAGSLHLNNPTDDAGMVDLHIFDESFSDSDTSEGLANCSWDGDKNKSKVLNTQTTRKDVDITKTCFQFLMSENDKLTSADHMSQIDKADLKFQNKNFPSSPFYVLPNNVLDLTGDTQLVHFGDGFKQAACLSLAESHSQSPVHSKHIPGQWQDEQQQSTMRQLATVKENKNAHSKENSSHLQDKAMRMLKLCQNSITETEKKGKDNIQHFSFTCQPDQAEQVSISSSSSWFPNASSPICMLVPSVETNSPPLDFSPEHNLKTTECVMDSAPQTVGEGGGFESEDINPPKMTPASAFEQSPGRAVSRAGSKQFTPGYEVVPNLKKPYIFDNSYQSSSQPLPSHEIHFPSKEEVDRYATPLRQVKIPAFFKSVSIYKQTLISALTELMNIQLFELAKTYHAALAKVDISTYAEEKHGNQSLRNTSPLCKCATPSKMAQVKKEGPNKGRFFFCCSGPRGQQCKFFKWVDEHILSSTGKKNSVAYMKTAVRPKLTDSESITGFFHSQSLHLYCQCLFLCRSEDQFRKSKIPHWVKKRQHMESVQKKSLFLKLPGKDSSIMHAKDGLDSSFHCSHCYIMNRSDLFRTTDSFHYGKSLKTDDLWIISKTLNFDNKDTFVARSTFHGPNSNGEVAFDIVSENSTTGWIDGSMCHALHAGNASTELACIVNLKDHLDLTSVPILPHLLNKSSFNGHSRKSATGFKAPSFKDDSTRNLHLSLQFTHNLAAKFTHKYNLNQDQARALEHAAEMMSVDAENPQSVMLIHGVFGAGKSFLLSILILFLVELFQENESYAPGIPFPWKLLLSSTTNVAVDRVLQGLLEFGFDDFVRVGSLKKIAKPVLPYSIHASDNKSQELKELQEMLKQSDITTAEKHLVRKSIERHKLGENRKRLAVVRVVGVTCAACSFQCLEKMHFPFVVLDECSQMTEPASLLPIARFSCEKLVLVGDPKQLDPTLQGSEAAHMEGLEQTLFDRLMKMGYDPVLLRIQYRCHPTISAVANNLFYNNQLLDGVMDSDRQPLVALLPTICFYDVSEGQERNDSSGSFFNEAEAQFVVLLLAYLAEKGLLPASIGVITLYKAQARRILDIIRLQHNENDNMAAVQISTVDAFQGGERDVIILSCVRSHSLGFIDCDKRMNVALTRARHHLLIVGNQRNLYRNTLWAQVISHCQGLKGGIVSSHEAARTLQKVGQQNNTVEHNPEPGSSSMSSEHWSKGMEGAISTFNLIDFTSPYTREDGEEKGTESSVSVMVTDSQKSGITGNSAKLRCTSLLAAPLINEDEISDGSDSDVLPDGL